MQPDAAQVSRRNSRSSQDSKIELCYMLPRAKLFGVAIHLSQFTEYFRCHRLGKNHGTTYPLHEGFSDGLSRFAGAGKISTGVRDRVATAALGQVAGCAD